MLLPDNFSDMTEQEFENWARAFGPPAYSPGQTKQKGGDHIETITE